MKKWQYLSVRFSFKGRGITQEFQTLDVDGERLQSYGKENPQFVNTLPEFLLAVGEDGWELAGHTAINNQSSATTEQLMMFKRPKEESVESQ